MIGVYALAVSRLRIVLGAVGAAFIGAGLAVGPLVHVPDVAFGSLDSLVDTTRLDVLNPANGALWAGIGVALVLTAVTTRAVRLVPRLAAAVALVALGVLLGPAIDVPTRPDEGGSFLIDDSPLGVFALNEGGLWVGLGLGTALGARVAWQQRHA